MIKLFLDTNILLDAYIENREFHEDAELILFLASILEFDVCISASQFTDFVYVATEGEKKLLVPSVQEWLKKNVGYLNIISVEKTDIEQMSACDWDDLEDYLVYCSALKSGCNVLITRDKDGFEKSVIPYMDAGEFFDWYEKNYNIRYCFEELASLVE